LAQYRRENIPEWQAMPLVVRALRVTLTLALDLTDGATRRSIRVSEQRMTSVPWTEDNLGGREALPQAIGRSAFEAGFQGLLVPSAALPHATTIVVFPGNLDATSSLETP
jgi:RES domain-containing protein